MAFVPVVRKIVRDPDKVLLLDGDIITYDASYGVEDDMVPAMKIKIDLKISAAMDDAGCGAVESYLTGSMNFRDGVAKVKQYKGNRYHEDGSRKKPQPKHLFTARAYMQEKHKAIMCQYEEADDAISKRNWQIVTGADPKYDKCVIGSTDKDLRINPGAYLTLSDGCVKERYDFGLIYVGPNGELKGHGLKFFLGQLLAGDGVDNIPGLPKVPMLGKDIYGIYRGFIGPTKAVTILSGVTTYTEGLRRVSELYDAYVDEFYPEGKMMTWDAHVSPITGRSLLCEQGRLLWMRRAAGEMWTPELDYSAYECELKELIETD